MEALMNKNIMNILDYIDYIYRLIGEELCINGIKKPIDDHHSDAQSQQNNMLQYCRLHGLRYKHRMDWKRKPNNRARFGVGSWGGIIKVLKSRVLPIFIILTSTYIHWY